MEVIDILRDTALFKNVKDDELQQIAASGTSRKCAKGDVIFSEGAEGKDFFIVTKGTVAINKNVAGGRKRNLSNLGPGEIFGELALFDSERRSADAEAIEDCDLIVFDNKQFLEFLKKHLVCAFIIQTRIIRVLCKRLRATDEMLNEGVIWGFSMEM